MKNERYISFRYNIFGLEGLASTLSIMFQLLLNWKLKILKSFCCSYVRNFIQFHCSTVVILSATGCMSQYKNLAPEVVVEYSRIFSFGIFFSTHREICIHFTVCAQISYRICGVFELAELGQICRINKENGKVYSICHSVELLYMKFVWSLLRFDSNTFLLFEAFCSDRIFQKLQEMYFTC